MNPRLRRFLLLLCLSLPAAGFGAINAYEFASPEQENRFRVLISELRCPKCQNQTLADSDAPLARDLKDLVHEKILAGESDAQILAFMHKRYGDFILYRPPVKPSTWLLWFGPAVLLGAGCAGLLWFVRQRSRRAEQHADPARLAALLAEADSSNTDTKNP